jgi:hypothetical protein
VSKQGKKKKRGVRLGRAMKRRRRGRHGAGPRGGRRREGGGGLQRWGRQAAVDVVLPYEPKAGDVHGVADGWARGLQ